jgi:hypothetical protein
VKTLEKVHSQLSTGEFAFSRHALKRVVERNIGDQDIRQAGMHATILEDYPDDKYSPSCLLLGFTNTGRPLHIHVSVAETELVKIITIYEPDPSEWVKYSQRR